MNEEKKNSSNVDQGKDNFDKIEELKEKIVDDIIYSCSLKQIPVTKMLASYVLFISTLDTDFKSLFTLYGDLEQMSSELVKWCCYQIQMKPNPNMETVKMQIYFKSNYQNRESYICKHRKTLDERLNPLVNGLIHACHDNARKTLDAQSKDLFLYLILKTGLGLPHEPHSNKEVKAALFSIIPWMELRYLLALSDGPRYLNQISHIVGGILLFNKESDKNTSEIDKVTKVIFKAAPAFLEKLKKEHYETSCLIDKLTDIVFFLCKNNLLDEEDDLKELVQMDSTLTVPINIISSITLPKGTSKIEGKDEEEYISKSLSSGEIVIPNLRNSNEEVETEDMNINETEITNKEIEEDNFASEMEKMLSEDLEILIEEEDTENEELAKLSHNLDDDIDFLEDEQPYLNNELLSLETDQISLENEGLMPEHESLSLETEQTFASSTIGNENLEDETNQVQPERTASVEDDKFISGFSLFDDDDRDIRSFSLESDLSHLSFELNDDFGGDRPSFEMLKTSSLGQDVHFTDSSTTTSEYLLKAILINSQQYLHYLKILINDATLLLKKIELYRILYKKQLCDLHRFLYCNYPAPTINVLPLLIDLSLIWTAMQEELVLLNTYSTLVKNIKPYAMECQNLLSENENIKELLDYLKEYFFKDDFSPVMKVLLATFGLRPPCETEDKECQNIEKHLRGESMEDFSFDEMEECFALNRPKAFSEEILTSDTDNLVLHGNKFGERRKSEHIYKNKKCLSKKENSKENQDQVIRRHSYEPSIRQTKKSLRKHQSESQQFYFDMELSSSKIESLPDIVTLSEDFQASEENSRFASLISSARAISVARATLRSTLDRHFEEKMKKKKELLAIHPNYSISPESLFDLLIEKGDTVLIGNPPPRPKTPDPLVKLFLPEMLQNFDSVQLEFKGICPGALIKGTGLLLPSQRHHGIAFYQKRCYGFSNAKDLNKFHEEPELILKQVKEVAKIFPELILFLQLNRFFDLPFLDEEPEFPLLKQDLTVQTDTHALPKFSNMDYCSNAWDLRRQASQLAYIRTKSTHAMQTINSFFRRESHAQCTDRREKGTQTKMDAHSQMPTPIFHLGNIDLHNKISGFVDTTTFVIDYDPRNHLNKVIGPSSLGHEEEKCFNEEKARHEQLLQKMEYDRYMSAEQAKKIACKTNMMRELGQTRSWAGLPKEEKVKYLPCKDLEKRSIDDFEGEIDESNLYDEEQFEEVEAESISVLEWKDSSLITLSKVLELSPSQELLLYNESELFAKYKGIKGEDESEEEEEESNSHDKDD